MWIGMVLPVIMFLKIITKKQAAFFVVIFLAVFIGYLVTFNEIDQRENIYALKEEMIKVEGTVSKIQESSYGWNIYLEKVHLNGNDYNRILVTVMENPEIKIGNKIQVSGRINQFEQAKNPGNFDSKKYYMSLGIYAKIEAEKVIVSDSRYDYVRAALYGLRIDIQNKLNKLCSSNHGLWKLCSDKSPVFSAILLGNKTELDTELKELYSVLGIAHILAISGLHISFIGLFAYSLMRKKFRFGFSASVAMTIVICFGIMSGMGIATIRAITMFGLRLLGEVLGRTYDSLTAISTAGILLMLWNPFVIFNSGFQMSFAAIIAIVLAWSAVQNILQIKPINMKSLIIDEKNITKKQMHSLRIQVYKNKLLNALLFSFNIGLVMNPIIAYNYFQLPTYSFLLNVIVVPLMSVVILSGLLGIGASFINMFAGRLLILPGCAVLELYTKLCRMVNRLPFSNVIVGKPCLAIIVVYYLIFFLFLLLTYKIRNKKLKEEKQRQKNVGKSGKIIESKSAISARSRKLNIKFVSASVCLCMLLNSLIYVPFFTFGFSSFTGGSLQITFLDVGQGDGIFMCMDNGMTVTVDGGSTTVDQVGRYRIIPFLKSQCIRKIDYAVMTHADNDHISGLVEMLEESDNNGVEVKNLVLPDIIGKDDAYSRMIQTANAHDVNVLYITKGDKMKLGNVSIRCIYPATTTVAEDRNDYSTVLSVHYGRFSMLLTGDISAEVESGLKNETDNHYTVLKVAHHGSKYSTSSDFLQWINPDYSVISAGEHNMYGHPSSETLERLEQSGSRILRTDESGAITVKTDGEMLRIDEFNVTISEPGSKILQIFELWLFAK